MTDQTTDFFDNIGGGAGAPTPILKNPGDYVHGQIVEMFKRDYIPFGKKDPELRDDGTKKQQLVIILQTTHRNWENVVKVPKVDPGDQNSAEKPPSDDDGKRAVYVPEGKNIQFAIARAVQAAKARPEVGGTLGVKIDKLTPTDKGNDLKEHEAVYQPPSAASGFFGGEQAPAQSAPPAQAAPQQAPPQQQAPAPAAPPAQAAPQQDPWAAPTQQPAPAAGDPWATPNSQSAPAANRPPF